MPRVWLFPGRLDHGGIGHVFRNLATEMVVQGAEVSVVTLGSIAPVKGCRHVVLPDRARDGLRALTCAMRTGRPDAVITARGYVHVLSYAAWRLSGRKAKLVWTFHTALGPDLAGGRWAKRLLDRLSLRLARNVNTVVAVSEGIALDLQRRGIVAEVISNPVWSASRQAEGCDLPVQSALAPPLIVAAGRMVPQKDFGTLLRAFELVARSRPLRLVVLGDGPQRQMLRDLCQTLGIDERVEFPGQVPSILPHLRAADLFVQSSRWEGAPLVLVEALCSGVQVIATDCPHGPAEILEGGNIGRLVPVGDPVALAQAIGDALDKPKPLTPEQRHRVALKYDCTDSARRYLDLVG